MSKYSQQFKVPELKQTRVQRVQQEKKSRCLRRQNAFDETRVMSPEPQSPQKTKAQLRFERLKMWKETKKQKIEEEKSKRKPGWKCIKHRFSIFGTVPNQKTEQKLETKNHQKPSTSTQQRSEPLKNRSCKSSKSLPVKKFKKTPATNQPIITAKSPEILVEYVPTPSTPSTSNNYQLTSDNHEFRVPFTQKRVDQILRQSLPLTPTNMVTRARKNKNKDADVLPDISYSMFSAIENDRNIGFTSTPSYAPTTNTNLGMFVVTPMKIPSKLSTNKSRRPSRGAFFEDLLDMEIDRLNSICIDWETILSEKTNIPSQIHDEIESTIGQTKLLITKKFEQFRKLTYGIGPNKIESEDLQGFWDMMYIQVEGLDARYVNLTKLQNNNWTEEVPVVVNKPRKTKKANNVKAVGASKGLKAAIAAAKKKMAEETKENDSRQGIINLTKLERRNFGEKSPQKEEKSSTYVKEEKSSINEEKRKTRSRRTNVFANILRAKKENRLGGSSGNSLNTSSPKPGSSKSPQ